MKNRHFRASVCTAFACAIALGTSMTAFAWDGTVTGTISEIDIAPGGNLGFRLYLLGLPAMCGNATNWAYLEPTDSNYNAYVAAALMGKSQGLTVTVFTTQDTSGYCHIGYFAIR